MIYIEPLGGLCNRMRAVNSALCLAELTKQKMVIVWRENEELNCPYTALFQLPDTIRIITVNSLFSKIRSKLLYHFCKIHLDDADVLRLRNENKVIEWENPQKLKSIYFKTGQQFADLPNFDFFQPVDDIVKRSGKIKERLGKQAIGIHIRRTDNKMAIEKSGLEGFVSAIEKELAVNPETMFYLATDDPTVEQEFVDKFNGHIVVQEGKKLDRNTESAIEDAYVDLLCLAATQKIYGSFYSSFSEIGAAIGKIPLEIITSDGDME